MYAFLQSCNSNISKDEENTSFLIGRMFFKVTSITDVTCFNTQYNKGSSVAFFYSQLSLTFILLNVKEYFRRINLTL